MIEKNEGQEASGTGGVRVDRPVRRMVEGEDVLVRLHGDAHLYHGRVLRPKKLEVELLEYNEINGTNYEPNFVADENSIESWGHYAPGARA